MNPANQEKVSVRVDDGHVVSGLLELPERARACYVLAHGAGAGMSHPFMAAIATALAERGVATLRYQFPYMERGSKRPDGPGLAHATVRAAVDEAARLTPGLPLVAGGKSFGGRMTSQTQAASPLAGVQGLAFLGFPLHPAKKPSADRARHLFEVRIPMLFLQGARDSLAEPGILVPVVESLGSRATLTLFADADHSFHVRARGPRTDAEVRAEIADSLSAWIDRLGGAQPRN
jgi:predicted alpha/beta-hydrolase family hydrolase